MDDSMNKIIAGLMFNITGALEQFELLEKRAAESAMTAQQAFAKTQLTAPTMNTGQLTAQQAMVNQIAAQGEAQKQAILNESNAKIAKMEAEAEYKRTATKEKESKARINAARVEAEELKTLTVAGKLEGIETANKNMLANKLAAEERKNKQSIANLEVTEKRKQAIAAESQAKIDAIQSKASISDAKAGVYDTKSQGILLQAQAKEQAILQESEAKKVATIAKGEAEISGIHAKEALTRQATITKQSQEELNIVRKQVEQEKLLYMQARQAAFEEKPSGFLGLIERHATWLAAGGLIYGTFELMKTGILDVSASMTKLQQVLEIVPPYDKSPAKLAKDLEELKDVAGVMATAYGVGFSQVLDVMSQAGRRFKDVASIISATDTALQLVVVDAVPVEAAIKSVEAIMSQFGLTTGESKQALFEISAAAHMLQINATDLLMAIQRSGSAFKTMKMDTKESIAAISTLAQMTAIAGGTIGNTWKSLEASFASDKGQKAMKELGIELFDSNGQLNDMSGKLVLLQDKWKTMSDQAKMHYAQVLAGGKFQYQKLEAFLDDYTGAYKKALAGIETANADMQKKLVEAAMTSLPQQMRMTQASLQVLTSQLTEDVTPALIMFLTSVRGGIKELQNHDSELRKILSTGATLAEAYIAWKVSVWAYTTVTKIATTETIAMRSAAIELELVAKGMPGALAGVAGGIAAIGVAAIGAAGKVAGIIGLLGVLDRMQGYKTDPAGQKVKDIEASIDDLESQFNGKWQPGTNLYKAWGDLKTGYPGDAFNHVMDAGFGFLPSAKSAREKAQEQLQIYNDQLRWAKQEKKAADEKALQEDLDNLNQLMAKYEKEANERTQQALKDMQETQNALNNWTGGGGSAAKVDYSEPFKEYIQTLESGLPAVDEVLADHNNALDLLGTKESIWKNATDGIVPTLEQQREEYGYLTQTIEQYKASQEDLAHLAGNKEFSDYADSYRAKMENIKIAIEQENAKEQAGIITKKQHRESVQLLQNEYDKLDKSVDSMSNTWWKDQEAIINTQKEYDNLDDSIAKLRLDELKQKFNDGLISAEQYEQGIESLEKEFPNLGKAMQEVFKQDQFNGILSAWNKAIDDALDKAQKKFDEAMDAIDEDIADAKQGLEDFKDAVSGVFDGIDTDKTFNFSEGILKDIPKILTNGMDFKGYLKSLRTDWGGMTETELLDVLNDGLYPAPKDMPGTLSSVGTLMNDIVNGSKFDANDSEKDVGKDQFLIDLKAGVEGLSNASVQIDASLNDVESWKNSEIRRIDSEIESVKTKLESDVKAISGLFDELDAKEAKYSRDTAKNNFTNSLNAAMGIKAAPGINPTVGDLQTLSAGLPGQLDLSNLGNLSAEQFASTIKQGLTTLEDAKLKAQGYIQNLADSTQTQIDAIDAQLKALDEEAKKDTRTDAEEEHNKKIAELQKKLAYESVRTGQEHLENMADINQQIADENESWGKTQRDWGKDDKRAELEGKKTALQTQKDLLTTALNDFVTYINSEIQTRKDATADYKANLEDQANADTAELETEKTNVQKRFDLLTAMLKGMKQYVTDEIAEWKRLADERVDITEDEVNAQVAAFEKQKTALSDLWNDKKTGIVAITRNGVLATLAMMAAMSDGFKTQGMAMVKALIDGITDPDLKQTVTDELNAILTATAGGVPSTTTPTTPTVKTTYTNPDTGKTVTTDIGTYNNAGKLVIGSSSPFSVGSYARSNGDGTYTVYKADGSTFSHFVDANGNNADDKHNAHLKAESDYATLVAHNWKQGVEDIKGKNYAAALTWYNQYIKDRSDMSDADKALFYDIVQQKKKYEGLAMGGIVPGGNPVLKMLGDAPYDEAVIPLPQIQPMIDKAILSSLTKTTKLVPDLSRINTYIKQIDGLQAQISVAVNSNFDKAADKIVAAIEKKMNIKFDKLINVEHYEPQDNTDVEIFGREVMRQVGQL